MSNSNKKISILGWIGSISLILFAIVSFSALGIVSGILFIACGVFINPICQRILKEKGITIKKVISIPAIIICLVIAFITFPSSNKADEEQVQSGIVESDVEKEEIESSSEDMFEESKDENIAIDEKETEEEPSKNESKAVIVDENVSKKDDEISKKETVANIQLETVEQSQIDLEESYSEIETEILTQNPTEFSEETLEKNQNEANSEVVFTGHYYATKSGECYHYSAECAGKNAHEITAEEAMRLRPCGVCVE